MLTPKLDRSRWYFETLLGMEVAHAAGKSLYLRGYGDYAVGDVLDSFGHGCIPHRHLTIPAQCWDASLRPLFVCQSAK